MEKFDFEMIIHDLIPNLMIHGLMDFFAAFLTLWNFAAPIQNSLTYILILMFHFEPLMLELMVLTRERDVLIFDFALGVLIHGLIEKFAFGMMIHDLIPNFVLCMMTFLIHGLMENFFVAFLTL